MRIAYRRMSGAVGLSSFEKGTRGLWYEKRKALLQALMARGHQVDLVNRLTKFSSGGQAQPPIYRPEVHDLLMIEFGSSNEQFYGRDLWETRQMVSRHRGQVIFVCDDPDLPYAWGDWTQKGLDRWTVWMNATRPQAFGGMSEEMRYIDAPIASLMQPPESPSKYIRERLVYIGRPNGREKAFREIASAEVPIVVCGKAPEWLKFGVPVEPAPEQSARSRFYQNFVGSLVLADAKHKRLGWRTGRAYHAVYAGCPAVVEKSHGALAESFATFETAGELADVFRSWTKEPDDRECAWRWQIKQVKNDRVVMEQAFQAVGL